LYDIMVWFRKITTALEAPFSNKLPCEYWHLSINRDLVRP